MTLRELFKKIETENPAMLDSEQFILAAKGMPDGENNGTLLTLNAGVDNFINMQRRVFDTFYDLVANDKAPEYGEDAEVFAQSAMVTALSYIAGSVVKKMGDAPLADSMFFTVLKDVAEHHEYLTPEYFFTVGGVDDDGNFDGAIGASHMAPPEIMASVLTTFEKMVKDELVEKEHIVEMLELSAKAFNDKL